MAELDITKAARLSRAIASDISVYNQDKIKAGLENDNFFEVMTDNFEEGRKAFKMRAGEEAANTNLFEKSIIDIIIAAHKNLKTPIF